MFSGLRHIRRVAGCGNAAVDAKVAPRNRNHEEKTPAPNDRGFLPPPFGRTGLLPDLATGDSL